MSVPVGIHHIAMIDVLSNQSRSEAAQLLGECKYNLAPLGTALSALYQAATCHQGCRGPPHLLEGLAGRAYNLAAAALQLALRGFYDEGLALVRSMAELYNLVTLSVVDRPSFDKWIAADKRTRLRHFSPRAVRELIEAQGQLPLFYDQDWYSEFCEKYAHVTPQTRPNAHGNPDQPVVGGIVQKEGMVLALDELSQVSVALALHICKYFDYEDLWDALVNDLKGAADS